MEKEINTRNYILTCWVKDITCESIYDFFINTDFFNKINKIIIGGIEKTENDLEHFHVFIKLKSPMRLNTLKKRLNISSTHIEVAKGTLEQCYNYCTKESCYYTNVIESDFKTNTLDDDVYSNLMVDIFENNLSIYEVCLKYGKIAVLHFGNLEKIFQVREKEEIRRFNERSFDESFDFLK